MLTQNKNRTPHSPHRYFSWTVWALLAALLLASCAPAAVTCPQQLRGDLSQALSYADNEALPFQYPLPELGLRDTPSPAKFCKGSFGLDPQKFHAAEDYHLPAGTPVYAFADGEISFSGRMGGYGWLIIVDHPQHNIYSLYGHLSPSRWKLESGMEVERGDLIGYLGDDDENGGSAKKPLVTHLHFGIRVGQRADYPGFGEWRWQAGWIKPCPTDLGWLKPSAVIVGQEIPPGGFPEPKVNFFEKWQGEIILSGIYILVGAGAIVKSFKEKNFLFPLVYAIMLILLSWYLSARGTRLTYALLTMAGITIAVAGYQFIQDRKIKGAEGEGREAKEELRQE